MYGRLERRPPGASKLLLQSRVRLSPLCSQSSEIMLFPSLSFSPAHQCCARSFTAVGLVRIPARSNCRVRQLVCSSCSGGRMELQSVLRAQGHSPFESRVENLDRLRAR